MATSCKNLAQTRGVDIVKLYVLLLRAALPLTETKAHRFKLLQKQVKIVSNLA